MNRKIMEEMSQRYLIEGLDFIDALKTWKKANLNSESIRDQIYYDINAKITSGEAKELYLASDKIANYGFKLEDFGMAEKVPAGMVPDGLYKTTENPRSHKDWGGAKVEAKDYEFSRGREDLIPENIKNRDKIVFTPSVRMSMIKVDKNVYRSKTAAKYWTLKEKMGEDGNKVVYLVAIEDSPEEVLKKEARYKIAQIIEDPNVTNPDPTVQPIQALPTVGVTTDQGLQTPIDQENVNPEQETSEQVEKKTDTSGGNSESQKGIDEMVSGVDPATLQTMQGESADQILNRMKSGTPEEVAVIKKTFFDSVGDEAKAEQLWIALLDTKKPTPEEVAKGFSGQGQEQVV